MAAQNSTPEMEIDDSYFLSISGFNPVLSPCRVYFAPDARLIICKILTSSTFIGMDKHEIKFLWCSLENVPFPPVALSYLLGA